MEEFLKSTDKYMAVEDLVIKVIDLLTFEQINALYSEWYSTDILTHDGSQILIIKKNDNLYYALFHLTEELKQYYYQTFK